MSTRGRTASLISIVAASVLLLLSGGVSAFHVSFDVVIVADRTAYRSGDIVNATVYVLDGGVLADPDSVSLVVTSFASLVPAQTVSLTHIAPGTYLGRFPITANMTSPTSTSLALWANATLGSLLDGAYLNVYVPRQDGLSVQVSLSAYEVSPGAAVDGRVSVTQAGLPRDPDSVNLSVWLPVPFDLSYAFYLYPPVTRLGTGTYGFTFTVPSTVNMSLATWVGASATVLQGNETLSYPGGAPLLVRVPEPFLVWSTVPSWAANASSVDIWVADPSGRPFPGATVVLHPFVTDRYPWSWRPSQSRLTDAQGRARFSVPPDDLTALGFLGTVTSGAESQVFGGGTSPPPGPGYSWLSLRRNNLLDAFEPGETAQLNYTPSFNGTDLIGTRLYYSVRTTTALLTFGSLVVPSSGSFTVQFPMPPDGATVDVSGQMPDGSPSAGEDRVEPEIRLDAQVGAFRTGGTTRIVASLPATGGPWTVAVNLFPYNESEYPSLRPDWSGLAGVGGIVAGGIVDVVDGTSFDANVTLPTFLPSGRLYYLEVNAEPNLPLGPGGQPPLGYVLRQLVYVEGPSRGPADPVVLLLSLFVTAGAVGVAAWILLLRPRKPSPSVPEGPPRGAPADEGPRATNEDHPPKG